MRLLLSQAVLVSAKVKVAKITQQSRKKKRGRGESGKRKSTAIRLAVITAPSTELLLRKGFKALW